jgi:4-diphosphocytidyl-2C-methyl-D-erythritol kinase
MAYFRHIIVNTMHTCDNKYHKIIIIIINISNSDNRYVTNKEAEKTVKYKDLITELQCMWNKKAKVIPAVNRDARNHFKITQTIPEQHTTKA